MFGFEPNLRIDDFALDVLLNAPNGDVGVWLRRRGRIMERAAKRDVGVKTGRLRASIYRKHERIPKGQMMTIGANAVKADGYGRSYAQWHHDGTSPHDIFAKRGGVLVFTSNGKVVKSRHVGHPGNRSNRYLSEQLKYLFIP